MAESPVVGFEWLWAQALPCLLVIFRVLGLLLFTPLLSATTAPAIFRAMLGAGLGLALFVGMDGRVEAPAVNDVMSLAALMVTELAIGLSLGLMASLPIIGLTMAGHVISYEMGLSVAQSYNPQLEMELDAVGQVLYFIGMSAFVATGGVERCFVLMAETFRRVPIGSFVLSGPGRQAPAELVIGLISSGMDLCLRLAAPAIGAVGLALIALGVIMKTIPQINVMTVGFSMKIMIGLLMVTLSLFTMHGVAVDDMAETLDLIGDWVAGLNAGGPR